MQHLLSSWRNFKPEVALKSFIEDLDAASEQVDALLAEDEVTWDSFGEPIERLLQHLKNQSSLLSYMASVNSSEAVLAAYRALSAKYEVFRSRFWQDTRLHDRFKQILESHLEGRSLLKAETVKALNIILQKFTLSGASLPEEAKAHMSELNVSLAHLGSEFGSRLMRARQQGGVWVKEAAELTGLAPSHQARARQKAIERGKPDHFYLSLDKSTYLAVQSTVEDRAVREAAYVAYQTLASERSGEALDNTPVVNQMLKLREFKAHALGFKTFAEFALASRMVATPKNALTFQLQLMGLAEPAYQKEEEALRSFAQRVDQISDLKAWDSLFYEEKLKAEQYAITQESLRSYFPLSRVRTGLFALLKKLFGIECHHYAEPNVFSNVSLERWSVHSESGTFLGHFLCDFFTRDNKEPGAWMNEHYIPVGETDRAYPVAGLTCNFLPPNTPDEEAYFTHEEVCTLFHEAGHCLHLLLTKVPVLSLKGLQGVPLDAIEIPSQWLESWCWDRSVLKAISYNAEEKAPLDDAKIENLLRSERCMPAHQLKRQLLAGIFDMQLHSKPAPSDLNEVRSLWHTLSAEFGVPALHPQCNLACQFTHLFSGPYDYAAGYYSYLWAEQFSAGYFRVFQAHPDQTAELGKRLREGLFAQGGAADQRALFTAVTERQPSLKELLVHRGFEDQFDEAL